MEIVTILVDVQNVYYTSKSAFQRHFDYNAFWAIVTKNRQVHRAFAYAIDRGDEKQRQFQHILKGIGFTVKLKPFIKRIDGTAKGDWDVGITIDAITHAEPSDTIILVSGDGDFSILAEHLRHQYQCKVEVYGVQSLTANALINAADTFHPINHDLLLT